MYRVAKYVQPCDTAAVFSSLLMLHGLQEDGIRLIVYVQCHETTGVLLKKAQPIGQCVFDTVNKKTACNSFFHI